MLLLLLLLLLLLFYDDDDDEPPGVHDLAGPELARLPHELLPRPLLPVKIRKRFDLVRIEVR